VVVTLRSVATGSTLDLQVLDEAAAPFEELVIDDIVAQRLGVEVPPVVTAPLEATASWLRPLTIDVTARDPQDEPINMLTPDLSGAPGAVFITSTDRTRGTLRWSPRITDVRDAPYVVKFTAINGSSSSATTSIHVVPNVVLNPSFANGLAGWGAHNGATLEL